MIRGSFGALYRINDVKIFKSIGYCSKDTVFTQVKITYNKEGRVGVGFGWYRLLICFFRCAKVKPKT